MHRRSKRSATSTNEPTTRLANDQPRGRARRDLKAAVALDRSHHQTDRFDSGAPALDRWLQRSASQAECRDAARTYVVADLDGVVVGYATLVAGQITTAEAAADVAKGMTTHFPIPVAIIARLAVDRSVQGTGVGMYLLDFALRRCLLAGDEVGMRAVVVDAIDLRAAGFYRRFGFKPVQGAPHRLMVPLSTLREAFAD